MPKGKYPRPPHCCKKCGEKDPTKFYATRRTECKVHCIQRSSFSQKGNKYLNRRRHLEVGLTASPPEQYDEYLAKQNGLCALCGKPPNDKDLQKILVVDHDHETGEMRGLIHGRCNSILGYAKEDTVVLQNAIRYLNDHRKVVDSHLKVLD